MPAGPTSAVVLYTMRAVHPSPRAADTSVTSGSSGFPPPPLSSWPLPPLLLPPGVRGLHWSTSQLNLSRV